jgi:hypothetical protein
MSGDLAAIGEAVTAGLAGRTVESEAGSGGASPHADQRCLNCGTPLRGRFCHGCGQKGHVHRTLSAISHDLLHAIFHFDGKFWRTLPLLFWRPGDLTRRYIHGERASFISPLALFLFAVFLTFAVFATFSGGAMGAFGDGVEEGFDASELADKQSEINAVRNKMTRELADLDAKIAAAKAAGTSTVALDAERESLLAGAKVMNLVDEAKDPEHISQTKERNFTVADVTTGFAPVDNLAKKMNENPGLMLYKVQSNAYKFAWALIPLSIPFLWLLYPFSRRFHVFDHFVFVTYSISFMLLWVALLRVIDVGLGAVGAPNASGLLVVATLIYPPLHIYWQVRGAYRSSRLGSFVRTLLLLFFALFIIIIFVMLLFALGAMG